MLVGAVASGCSTAGKNRFNRLIGRYKPAQSILPPPGSPDAGKIQSGVPVLVTPAAGLSAQADGRASQLSNAIAARLVTADILATTRNAASQSYVLGSRIDGDALAVLLSRPDGLTVGTWRVPLGGPAANLDSAGIEALASRVAAAVLGRAEAETAGPAPAPAAAAVAAAPPAPSVVVAEVKGAPGDGNSALRSALGRALAVGGLAVLGKPLANSLTVHGKVTIKPLTPQVDHVTLAWEVRSPAGD
ncbi:hypothetical protein D3874_06625 [Oleomonas cavernae]|uniref:Uncharacterized protein n=1 Tax=Oleomonas cavernae TaxID=2320859 RepID=A0A418W9P5_9PROT|nr:hypothetical protein [Oleomonas cavernae]RJF86735.1 hypothetical protein D3874_06625 [Oleomonas cavernae]